MMIFEKARKAIKQTGIYTQVGKIISIHGLIVEAAGCTVQLGELVKIIKAGSGESTVAEVVGLSENRILLMPFHSIDGLCLDSEVLPLGSSLKIDVSDKLLGRVISPLGEPLDELGSVKSTSHRSTKATAINPLARSPIDKRLVTGVSALDYFTPLGEGQRIGIFAGSGVGKSTLLGAIAKNASVDVIVIALVGERGREVGDFIKQNLGAGGLRRSVLVVATAGDTAVMRRQAAFSATAIAEWFRSEGKSVLLIMDSITRLAMAQREIGISIREPMGSRGYPPSAFALIPPLVEAAGGLIGRGSVTAVYTVLVEGDDFNEPISDFMRSILDGHILLTRENAEKGQYPAIDIPRSISRLEKALCTGSELNKVKGVREMLSRYEDSKELIELGVYKHGDNPLVDMAISVKRRVTDLIKKSTQESFQYDEFIFELDLLVAEIEELHEKK